MLTLRRLRRIVCGVAAASALAACSSTPPPREAQSAPSISAGAVSERTPSKARPPPVVAQEPETEDPPPLDSGTAAADEEPTLPEGIAPGTMVEAPSPNESSLRVIHGTASTRRAVVYLHGACGDIAAPAAFGEAIADYGTLIALRGDRRCGNRPGRYYWSGHAWALDQRVRRALAHVKEIREGLLDESPITLFGYSNGANAAQELAKRYPERYPRVVLAGSPSQPSIRHLAKARAVAVVAGEHELQFQMKAGVKLLELHDVPVRFFELPGVGHGQYGPDASEVIARVLEWFDGASQEPREAPSG